MMPATQAARERVAAEQAAEEMLERHGPLPAGEGREARRARQRWMRRCRELQRRFLVEDAIADASAARALSVTNTDRNTEKVGRNTEKYPQNEGERGDRPLADTTSSKEAKDGRDVDHLGAGRA
jgi:hypothetical protein